MPNAQGSMLKANAFSEESLGIEHWALRLEGCLHYAQTPNVRHEPLKLQPVAGPTDKTSKGSLTSTADGAAGAGGRLAL
jgi:hypothetical protein